MQPLIKIFEYIGALFLYTLTALKFTSAMLLVGGAVLFIPFFFIERTLGYDLFGMVGLTGKFIEWGYTVLLLGITILVLPLYWIVYDLQHDPMILGVIVLAVSLWIGYKVLNAYTKHLNK